jgi:hypothetical protein
MDYTWEEIDQLAELLEAEATGSIPDPGTTRRLALRLAGLCPEISATMGRVAQRMAEYVERVE